jgi:hypothetical protein
MSNSDDLTVVDWLLCIFCSAIGCIVGIVYLVRGDSRGGKMIGISILFIIIWNVLRYFLANMANQQVVP